MTTNINRIKFIERKDIDLIKYNNLIEQCKTVSIYNYAWYLDAVSDNWGVLISGDYEAILPIPYTLKYGFKIIYQPFFTREISIYSQEEKPQLSTFIKALPNSFKKIDFNYSEFENLENFEIQKVNYQELDLNLSYTEIYTTSYSKNTKRLIKKALKQNIKINETIDVKTFIDFFKENTGEQVNYTNQHYKNINQLIEVAIKNKTGKLFEVTKEGSVIAYGFFFIQKHRITYLKGSVNKIGKKNGAMFSLMDKVIKEYAGENKHFDFGGSKIESIAQFYKKFGARDIAYYTYKKNDYSWIVKKGKNIRDLLKF